MSDRAERRDAGTVLPIVLVVTVVLAVVVIGVATFGTANLRYGQVVERRSDQLAAAVQKEIDFINLGGPIAVAECKKLVREVIVDPSKVFYDSNTSQHHHFYNTDTHRLTDIEHHLVGIDGLPEVPEDTEVEGVEVIVRIRNKT